MANSSDWLAALALPEPDTMPLASELAPVSRWGDAAPDWLAMLADDAGAKAAFRESLPFGEPLPPPAPLTVPAAEPLATAPPHDPLAAAHARAFAEGEAAGRAAAQAAGEAQAVRQRALRLALRTLDEAAMAVLAADLATTVLSLCEGVLGEAAKDRDALLHRCHAAARRMGGAADSLALHLHPDDAEMLGPQALAGWRIVPDASLEAGSVLIEGPDGSVCDGPAEWRRAIAAAVQG